MEKTGVAAAAIGIVVVGIMAYLVIKKMKTASAPLTAEETLETCFGEPMHTNVFTLEMAKSWLKTKETALKSSSKALIMKATKENLSSIGINKEFKEDYSNVNYLIIALVDVQRSDVTETLLIKYEELEERLEKLLEKGNGTVVIGG